MSKPSAKSGLGTVAVANIIRLLSVASMLAGTCSILIGRFGLQGTYTQNMLLNIGCGFVTAGVLSFFFDLQTRKINDMVAENMTKDTVDELKILIRGESGLTVTIENQLESHNKA